MTVYSAELYTDDGQANDPAATLVKVRFQPPVRITSLMQSLNGFSGIEVGHYATTQHASVYNLWVNESSGQNTEEAHQKRIQRAAEFVANCLKDVNEIDDLESAEWAKGLQYVEINQER